MDDKLEERLSQQSAVISRLREFSWESQTFLWSSTGGTLTVYWNLELYIGRRSSTSYARWYEKHFGGPNFKMKRASKKQKMIRLNQNTISQWLEKWKKSL